MTTESNEVPEVSDATVHVSTDIEAALVAAIAAGNREMFWDLAFDASGEDFAKALPLVQSRADAGDPSAFVWLSLFAVGTQGYTPDITAWISTLEACETEDAVEAAVQACLSLATFYAEPDGGMESSPPPEAVQMHRREAVRLLEAALQRDSSYSRECATLLGWLLTEGRGVEIDALRAADLFERASRAREPHAYIGLDTSDTDALPVVNGNWVNVSVLMDLIRVASPEHRAVLIGRIP